MKFARVYTLPSSASERALKTDFKLNFKGSVPSKRTDPYFYNELIGHVDQDLSFGRYFTLISKRHEEILDLLSSKKLKIRTQEKFDNFVKYKNNLTHKGWIAYDLKEEIRALNYILKTLSEIPTLVHPKKAKSLKRIKRLDFLSERISVLSDEILTEGLGEEKVNQLYTYALEFVQCSANQNAYLAIASEPIAHYSNFNVNGNITLINELLNELYVEIQVG